MSEKILIADDHSSKSPMSDVLRDKLGYTVTKVSSGDEIIGWLTEGRKPQPELIALDLPSLGGNGIHIIRGIRTLKPEIPLIAFTAYGDEETPAAAIAAGVTEFMTKPVSLGRLKHTLNMTFKMTRMANYMSWLERRISGHADFSDIIGNDEKIKQAMRLAEKAAASRATVWLEGETGTGKELFARAIHGVSDRAGKPFVVVDCNTLSPAMLEAVLFGRDTGSSDVDGFMLGKMREAEHGTLLLKEIGSLPPSLQQKLETYLEVGMIEPFGAKQKMIVDVRIMCASSKPAQLSGALTQQLQSIVIRLPALSDRKQDIPLLVDHFIDMYAAAEQKYVRGATPEARNYLFSHAWPGNIQQLARALRRAVILSQGEWIGVSDLSQEQQDPRQLMHPALTNLSTESTALLDTQGKVKTLRSVQEEAIRFALQYSGGCMTRAAKSLGIGRSTLYRKLDEFRISNNHISRANQTTRPMMKVSATDRS